MTPPDFWPTLDRSTDTETLRERLQSRRVAIPGGIIYVWLTIDPYHLSGRTRLTPHPRDSGPPPRNFWWASAAWARSPLPQYGSTSSQGRSRVSIRSC